MMDSHLGFLMVFQMLIQARKVTRWGFHLDFQMVTHWVKETDLVIHLEIQMGSLMVIHLDSLRDFLMPMVTSWVILKDFLMVIHSVTLTVTLTVIRLHLG